MTYECSSANLIGGLTQVLNDKHQYIFSSGKYSLILWTRYLLYRRHIGSWRRCEKTWNHSWELGHWRSWKLWHIRVPVARPQSIWICKSCAITRRILVVSLEACSCIALLKLTIFISISSHVWWPPVRKQRWRPAVDEGSNRIAFFTTCSINKTLDERSEMIKRK